MTEKVVGLDKTGKQIWERNAREYDRSISNSLFGITIGEAIKVVSVVAVGAMLYANQLKVNEQLMQSIKLVSETSEKNSEAILGVKDVLWNLNNYLSASTGKQFKDGIPR